MAAMFLMDSKKTTVFESSESSSDSDSDDEANIMLKKAMSLTTKHRLKTMIGEALQLTRRNIIAVQDFADGQAAKLRYTDQTGLLEEEANTVSSLTEANGTKPVSRFRRKARVVLLLIKVCNVCKHAATRGVRKEPWYALVDNVVATTSIQHRRKGYRPFVTFVPNEAKELIQLTFDAGDFNCDHRTEFLLTDNVRQMMSVVPGQRRPEQVAEILRCLKTLSTDFASYALSTQKQICQMAFYDSYKFNRVIIKKSHHPDGIYFVLSGQLTEKKENRKHPKEIQAGEKFGETDLLCCRRRRHTIVTRTDTELFYLHRQDYKVIFEMADDTNNPKHLDICKQHAVFQHFPMQRLVENPGVWSVVKYKYGQLIAKDGNHVDWIYVIKSGEARILKYLDPGNVDVQARRRKIQALLNSQSPFYQKKRLLDFVEDRDYMRSSYKAASYHPPVANRVLPRSAPPSTSRRPLTSSSPARRPQASVSLPGTRQGQRQTFLTRPSTVARQERQERQEKQERQEGQRNQERQEKEMQERQELLLPKLVIDTVPADEEEIPEDVSFEKKTEESGDVSEDAEAVEESLRLLTVPPESPHTQPGALKIPQRDLREERPERPETGGQHGPSETDDVSLDQVVQDTGSESVRPASVHRQHAEAVKQILAETKTVAAEPSSQHQRRQDPEHGGRRNPAPSAAQRGPGDSRKQLGGPPSFVKTPVPGAMARKHSANGRKSEPPSRVIQVGNHTLPAFVQVETLSPGQVFGLRACLDPEERGPSASLGLRACLDPEERGPSASLVSGECEMLQINKNFFMRHCDDAIYGLIRLKNKPFPSEEDLIDRLDVNMRWEEYKQQTLSTLLGEGRSPRSKR